MLWCIKTDAVYITENILEKKRDLWNPQSGEIPVINFNLTAACFRKFKISQKFLLNNLLNLCPSKQYTPIGNDILSMQLLEEMAFN